MSKSRLSYFALWLLTGLWVLLQETGVLPQHFLPSSPMADYAANLLCITTAVGGTYLAYRSTGLARAAFTAAAIVPSAIAYYGCAFTQTPLYCLLIALTGSLVTFRGSR